MLKLIREDFVTNDDFNYWMEKFHKGEAPTDALAQEYINTLY